jgi:hypothetical protein
MLGVDIFNIAIHQMKMKQAATEKFFDNKKENSLEFLLQKMFVVQK